MFIKTFAIPITALSALVFSNVEGDDTAIGDIFALVNLFIASSILCPSISTVGIIDVLINKSASITS